MKLKTILPRFSPTSLDERDARLRIIILNISVTAAIFTTLYFGVMDLIYNRKYPALVSFLLILVFIIIMWINIRMPKVRPVVDVLFVLMIGALFIGLLITRFPDSTIVLWCFPFPLLAMFLLGRGYGGISVIIYNIGVIAVFLSDLLLPEPKYGYEYAVRYCSVMIVISVLAFYYESLRLRSYNIIRKINLTLEDRIREKTKELEESRERLYQSEKLEAIGLLAGGIAHDFNNHLTGITVMSEMLLSKAGENAEIRECAECILTAARRSSELTGQLLAFARKGNIQTVPVDVHKIIGEVIALLGRTIDKRITINRKLAAYPSTTIGDPARLENALLNLAINACDAMPSGGEITFSTGIVTLGEAECRKLHFNIAPGEYINIGVSDTGRGIDPKIKNRIFEPFFTTKEPGKGSGMGLPSVYGTIQSHNGAITVESKEGQGTTFRLYLPIVKEAEPVSITEEKPMSAKEVNGHILVVDDETVVAESIKHLLKKMGFEVTVRKNGKEAVDYYSKNFSSVDLVILDMVMPVKSGKDTFLEMKKINPDLAALITSGYCFNEDIQQLLDGGARGFIQKPFDVSELKKKLFAIFGSG